MRIDSIELFHLAIPLRQPRPSPCGMCEKLEVVLLAMHADGATGWGEASPGNAPCAGPEWTGGVYSLLRDRLVPATLGLSVSKGNDLGDHLAAFRGNQFAKSALDTACWDLRARLQNEPLAQFLSSGSAKTGEANAAIEVGATFDQMPSIDDLLAAISAAVEAGCSRVKLKFRPGWDVAMVDFVRKEFPVLAIAVDCEAALTLGQTEMLYRLEDFSPAMIEQPLPADDLVGHAMVQQSLRTAICLDEGITTVAQAEMAIELQSCKCMNLKPGRVGGLTPALAIHDLCQDAGMPCYVGAAPQTGVGLRHGLALAARPNCTEPADFFPYNQLLTEDLVEPLRPEKDPSDGRLRVPLWSRPGIGVEPDRAILDRCCIAKTEISTQRTTLKPSNNEGATP